MEFDVESYTGVYMNRTDTHLYIAPPKGLERVVAHYTITFSIYKDTMKEGGVLNLFFHQ